MGATLVGARVRTRTGAVDLAGPLSPAFWQ